MDTTTISLVGGLLIAIITIIGNVVISIITKRSETEKEIARTVMENSFKAYEFSTKIGLEMAKEDRKSFIHYPYDYYMFVYFHLVRELKGKKLTEKRLIKIMNEMKKIKEVYKRHADITDIR